MQNQAKHFPKQRGLQQLLISKSSTLCLL